MRLAAIVSAALVAAGLVTAHTGVAQAEYYCSPGFEPSYGGQCVATLSRDEVNLYLNEPGAEGDVQAIRPHRHRHRRGLTARY